MKEICYTLAIIWTAGGVVAVWSASATGLVLSLLATAIIWPSYLWFRMKTGYEQ